MDSKKSWILWENEVPCYAVSLCNVNSFYRYASISCIITIALCLNRFKKKIYAFFLHNILLRFKKKIGQCHLCFVTVFLVATFRHLSLQGACYFWDLRSFGLEWVWESVCVFVWGHFLSVWNFFFSSASTGSDEQKHFWLPWEKTFEPHVSSSIQYIILWCDVIIALTTSKLYGCKGVWQILNVWCFIFAISYNKSVTNSHKGQVLWYDSQACKNHNYQNQTLNALVCSCFNDLEVLQSEQLDHMNLFFYFLFKIGELRASFNALLNMSH